VRPAALLAALSALGLTMTLMVGPALAVDEFALVTDHVPFSSDANHPEFWESEGVDCEDIGVDSGDTHTLAELPAGEAYVQVIVKSGAADSANTVFGEPPVAGQKVYADTNGNSMFDDGDQEISHIIVCTGEAEESDEESMEESEEPPSMEASVEESVEASVEQSVEASVEQSVEESAEGSVEGSAEGSVEGSVLGGTGTPDASTPDTAMGPGNGPSPLPTVVFGGILLASLAGLAWVNVQAVRTRS
jgi:hypothetical protein